MLFTRHTKGKDNGTMIQIKRIATVAAAAAAVTLACTINAGTAAAGNATPAGGARAAGICYGHTYDEGDVHGGGIEGPCKANGNENLEGKRFRVVLYCRNLSTGETYTVYGPWRWANEDVWSIAFCNQYDQRYDIRYSFN